MSKQMDAVNLEAACAAVRRRWCVGEKVQSGDLLFWSPEPIWGYHSTRHQVPGTDCGELQHNHIYVTASQTVRTRSDIKGRKVESLVFSASG